MKTWAKIAWSIVAMVVVIFALFNIFHHIIVYASFPIASTTRYIRRQSNYVPNILICPLNPLNATYYNSLTSTAQGAAKYALYNNVPRLSQNEFANSLIKDVQERWNASSSIIQRVHYDAYLEGSGGDPALAYGSFGWQCRDTIESCILDDTEQDCCNFTRTLPTRYGPCMFVNFTDPGLAFTSAGVYNQLSIFLKFRQDLTGSNSANTDDSAAANQNQFSSRVFVANKWEYYPTRSFSLNAGFRTEAAIRQRENSFIATDLDAGESGFHDLLEKEEEYGFELNPDRDCYASCLVLQIRSVCHCNLPYINLVWPPWDHVKETDSAEESESVNKTIAYDLCTLAQSKECVEPQLAIFDNRSRLGNKKHGHNKTFTLNTCIYECENENGINTRYDISVARYPLRTPWVLPSDQQVVTSPESTLHLAEIVLYAQSLEAILFEEYYAFPFSSLLWYIGLTIILYTCLFCLLWLIIHCMVMVCKCSDACRPTSVADDDDYDESDNGKQPKI